MDAVVYINSNFLVIILIKSDSAKYVPQIESMGI